MPFDPDAYLAQKTSAPAAQAPSAGGFNPDAYLAEKGVSTEIEQPSEGVLPSQIGQSYSGGVGPVNGKQIQFGGNPLNTQFSEFAQDSPALKGPSYEEATAKIKDNAATDPQAAEAARTDQSRALWRNLTG